MGDSRQYGDDDSLEYGLEPACPGVLHRLLAPLAAPVFFFRDWLTSRPVVCFIQSLPLLVLIGGAATVSLGMASSRQELLQRYSAAAKSCVEREDYDGAEICFQRLTSLGESASDAAYARALMAERKGELQTTERLMRQLASSDGAGDPHAHLWLAKHLAKGKTQLPAAEAEKYREHLARSVEGDPKNAEAQAMLGAYYFATRAYDKAAEHLAVAVGKHPELGLSLAMAYAATPGRSDAALEAARKAASHFQQQAAVTPDSVELVLQLSQAHVLLAEFPQAEQTLVEAVSKNQDERLRRTLSNVLCAWFNHLWQGAKPDRGQGLDLTKRALQHDPANLTALTQLARLATGDDEPAREASAMLAPLIENQKAPAQAHFILGSNDLLRGDYASAIAHLERVNELQPNTAEVLNNLAWAFAHQAPPDLERALSLANEAVKLKPQDHGIRETRGQILARLGRHREALEDLEFALPRMTNNSQLHETLAEIYSKLGLSDMADMHRRLAAANSSNKAE